VRRIGRYILNGLTVLSLVLCVATVGLWVRSHVAMDFVTVCRSRDGQRSLYKFGFGSGGGTFMVHMERARFSSTPPPALASTKWGRDHDSSKGVDWKRFGSDPLHESPSIKAILIPHTRVGAEWYDSGSKVAFPGIMVRVVYFDIVLPYWIAAILTASLPFVRLLRRVTRHRRAARVAGLCPACSYDLRATPDRCPECGTIPTKVKA
jgi:hypothetical protein